jgi:DNA (cytosine-5)-methyltransferase 1
MKAAGLFSGIGGIEEGFRRAGLSSELLCEIDGPARRVLKRRFSDLRIERDVRELKSLANLVAAWRTVNIRAECHFRAVR